MKFCIFGLILPLALAAQVTVSTSGPGEPVKKANLLLRRADLSPNTGGMPTFYSSATDAGGAFAMRDLEPGKYRLSVNRTGFGPAAYGERGAMLPGTTLSLDR